MSTSARRVLRDTGADTVRGIALVCACYALLTVGDVAVKWSLPAAGLAGAMIGRAVFGMPAVAVLAMLRGGGVRRGWRRLRPVRWRLVALRGLLHSFVSLTWYVAWLSMTLADTYAIGFTTPLLMTLLAVPLLGERIRWRRAGAILLGFAGVLVMLRPGGGLWSPGLLVMLAGLLPLAFSRILNRLLSTTETAECLSFWLLAAHLPAGLLLWAWLPIPALAASGVPWAALAALALLGLTNGVAHWLQSRAFALAPVGALAPYEYTALLWGGGLGWLVFGEVPARDAVIGSAIVAAAGLYNLHREQLRRRAELLAADLPAAPPHGVPVAAALRLQRRP
jgi:drug/metabolite transporter (DMT)-like permease